MISINEYLISKSNAKNLKNPEEVFDNESLDILYQKCIETDGTAPKVQMMNALRTYDAYIKTHAELGDLVDCLAEVAEKHITGEGSANYVYINARDAKRHPLKKDHYVITLRFNQNYLIETIIWEDRSYVGFTWRDADHGWTLDFFKKYSKNYYDPISHSKSSEYYGHINKETIDAIISQIKKIVDEIYK